ncbi:hypothetical protein Godav_020325 [Gossypium davidsonii]|uniref:Uncharacterized protein n=1 Tax=Gossypium davidsonii TaxID=34287 RepID=A0A7J8R3V8_GOSDV|nr:hypothetical protein [Gossypium davidsonii]
MELFLHLCYVLQENIKISFAFSALPVFPLKMSARRNRHQRKPSQFIFGSPDNNLALESYNATEINNSSPSTQAPPSKVARVPTHPSPAASTPVGATKNEAVETKDDEETKNAKA